VPEDGRFAFLHAAQLIKHILGLKKKHALARFRLLYLWYDAFGKAGYTHRREADAFAEIVRSDGVAFHHTTYQEVITRLLDNREQHPAYVDYLAVRYL